MSAHIQVPADELADCQNMVQAHCAEVKALQRSPFFRDILLSIGGWTFALWKEGQHTRPLLQSPFAAAQYTCATWSATRPGTDNKWLKPLHVWNPSSIKAAGVLFAGREDGTVEGWDLLQATHKPVLCISVAASPVTSMAASPMPSAARPSQNLLAVGVAGPRLQHCIHT